VFIVVVYFVIDPVRKLLDTTSYVGSNICLVIARKIALDEFCSLVKEPQYPLDRRLAGPRAGMATVTKRI
jgi:hypothetical protein